MKLLRWVGRKKILKLILTDIDGVVLQWGNAFGLYVKEIGLVNPDHEIQQFYDVAELLNITEEEANKLVLQFHDSEYFKHLTPYSDAVTYLHKLAREGYRFIAISAVGDTEHIYQSRLDNLNKYFFHVFEDLHIVSPRTSKIPYLSKYSNAIWIEDSLEHAKSGVEVGHTSLFMDRGDDLRNQKAEPPIITVESWQDVYNYLKNNDS